MSDAPVTRDEINRLWADTKMLMMLVCSDIGRRWGREEVDRWHQHTTDEMERTSTDPAVTANALRALDRIGMQLRKSASD